MNEENLARIEAFCEELGRLVRGLQFLHQEATDLSLSMAFAIGASEPDEEKRAA